MSVKGERLPSERTILTALDLEARKTVKHAQTELGPVVTAITPRHSGRTAQALRPKIGRTTTGVSLTVAPARGKLHSGSATVAQVIRYVSRGTGIHRVGGGPKSPIRGKRRFLTRGPLKVYGRPVSQVAGQQPNPFMDRIRAVGALRVEFRFRQGAHEAARALERVID